MSQKESLNHRRKLIETKDLNRKRHSLSIMSSKSTTLLIVEKTGSIKEVVVKKVTEEELYKKAGYKTGEGFKCHTTWSVDLDGKSFSISLYGKTTGRANQENKYEFPPPVDKLLFFGNCLLVNQDKDNVSSISAKEWEDIYEKLYGGFEDIGEEDSEDEFDEEEDEMDDLKLTKSGYAKDGFIVEDEDDEDDEDEEDDEEEEEDDNDDDDAPKIKAKKNLKKKVIKKSKKHLDLLPALLKKEEEDETFLDCKSELSEESYLE